MTDKYRAVGKVELAKEAEVLGANLPHCHFVQRKSTYNLT
jgi:hypothetical protein